MDKWCNNQYKCKEDIGNTFTCVAYMSEGRVSKCPYKNFEDRQEREYPCSDYEEHKK